MNKLLLVQNFEGILALVESILSFTKEYGLSTSVDSRSRHLSYSTPIPVLAQDFTNEVIDNCNNVNICNIMHATLRILNIHDLAYPTTNTAYLDPISEMRRYLVMDEADNTLLRGHMLGLFTLFGNVDLLSCYTPSIFKNGNDGDVTISPPSRGIFYISGTGLYKHQRYRYMRALYKQGVSKEERDMGVFKLAKSAMRTPDNKLVVSDTRLAALMYAWAYSLLYSGNLRQIITMHNLSTLHTIDMENKALECTQTFILPATMKVFIKRAIGSGEAFANTGSINSVLDPLRLKQIESMSKEDLVKHLAPIIRNHAIDGLTANYRPRKYHLYTLSGIDNFGKGGSTTLKESTPALYTVRNLTPTAMSRNSTPGAIPWEIPFTAMDAFDFSLANTITPAAGVNVLELRLLHNLLLSNDKFAHLASATPFYMASYEVIGEHTLRSNDVNVATYIGNAFSMQIILIPKYDIKFVVEYRRLGIGSSGRTIVEVNEWA